MRLGESIAGKWLCVWNAGAHTTSKMWQQLANLLGENSDSTASPKCVWKIARVLQRDARVRFDLFVDSGAADRIVSKLHKHNGWLCRKHVPYVQRRAGRTTSSTPPGPRGHLLKSPRDMEELLITNDDTVSGAAAEPVVPTQRKFRFVTWNICSLERKKELLMNHLSEVSVDFLAIQEHMRREDDWALNLSGFQVFSSPAFQDSGAERARFSRGVALYVKRGIPCFLRGMTADYVLVQALLEGTKILVVAFYMPNDYTRFNKVLLHLTRDIAKVRSDVDHVLVMGDFNVRDDKIMARLASVGLDLFLLKLTGDARTFKQQGKRSTPIDYMLVSDSMVPLCSDCKRLENWSETDHYAVQTVVTVAAGLSPVTRYTQAPRLKTAVISANWERIVRNNRFALLEPWTVDDDDDDVSMNVGFFTDNFNAACVEVIAELSGKKRAGSARRHGKEPYLPKEIVRMLETRGKAHDAVFSVADKIRESTEQESGAAGESDEQIRLAEEYKAATENLSKSDDKVRAALKEFRENKWHKHVREAVKAGAENRAGDLYRWCGSMISGGRAKSIAMPVKDRRGELRLHPIDIMTEWTRYYTDLGTDTTGHSRNVRHWEAKLNPATDRPELAGLNDDINWGELRQVVQSMAQRKSPGESGVTIEFLAACVTRDEGDVPTTAMGKALLFAVRGMFYNGVVPKSQRSSTIVNIFKKGDPTDMGNYRGISLIESIIKIVCTVINRRLCRALEDAEILCKEQAGFRKKQEGIAQVVALTTIVKRRKADDRPTYVAFLDFKKAYDRVPHGAMLRKLANVGVKGRCLEFISSLYDQSTSRVRLPNGLSEEIPLLRGLRQGCPLSCLIFDVFINDLIDNFAVTAVSIPGIDQKCGGLLFADDVAVLAETKSGMKQALKNAVKWCETWEMELNVSKCGIMVCFGGPDDVVRSTDFRIRRQLVPVVDCYTYLGIPVDKQVSTSAITTRRCESVKKARAAMHPFLSSVSIPAGIRLKVLKSVLVPIANFGGELLGFNDFAVRPIQTAVDECLCTWLVGRPKSKTALRAAVQCEAQVSPVWASTTAARARLLVKAKEMRTWIKTLLDHPGPRVPADWFQLGVTKLKALRKKLNLSEDTPSKTVAQRVRAEIWNQVLCRKNVTGTAGWKRYESMRESREYLKVHSMSRKVIRGTVILMKMRIGNPFATTSRLVRGGIVDIANADVCPFCSSGEEETIAHIISSCAAWGRYRKRMLTGVANDAKYLGIFNELSHLLSAASMQNIEDLALLLLGGRAGKLSLLPEWFGGERKSEESSKMLYAWGGKPIFRRVAKFLYKVHVKRWEFLGKKRKAASMSAITATSQSPKGTAVQVGPSTGSTHRSGSGT